MSWAAPAATSSSPREDISQIFGGAGDDFILAGPTDRTGRRSNLPDEGDEGDDWIEKGTQDGAPGDNFAARS